MLTAATYKQQSFIRSDERKKEWINAFLSASELYHCEAIAWVVLDNHYHAVLKSPNNSAKNLPRFVASYHKFTARQLNNQDNLKGRMVWWNYWDTCIRSQEDYFNKLRYVFWNPIKHGLVKEPEEYPYSNYLNLLKSKWVDLNQTLIEVEDVPEY